MFGQTVFPSNPCLRVLASLFVRLFSILQLWTSLEGCFAVFSRALDLVLVRKRQTSMWDCALPSIWPAIYFPLTSSAQYWSLQLGWQGNWDRGSSVLELDDYWTFGMFLYCTVHSPACRIVQMRNLANTHVGARNVLYGFCFLPLAPSDYIFRSSRYYSR